MVDMSDTESSVEGSQVQQLQTMLEASTADWSNLDSDESDDDQENEGPGQLCDVKTLYEGNTKCACCVNWVEEIPTDIEPAADEQNESKRHALLIRMRRNHSDGRPMVLHSIVVQSAYLKSILGEVFQEYSGITTTLKKLVFKTPFRCFFYEWTRLEKIVNEVEDPVSKSHARLMRRILRSELRDTISLSNDLIQSGVITYDYLWAIFKPGIDIYAYEDGHDRIYRLQKAIYVSGPAGQFYQLTVNEVECDGNGFGYSSKTTTIFNFPGTKRIQDLEVFPASFHPRLSEVKHALRKRGEMFRAMHLKPYYYGSYKGTIHEGKHSRNVSAGRIIVDPASYTNFTEGCINILPFDSSSLKPMIDVSDETHQPAAYPGPPRMGGMPGGMGPMPRMGVKHSKRPELTEDLLHLCSAYVRGYCFKIKKWVVFDIDNIQEIEWHDGAFDSLVLAGGYKRLIQAFVESHVENKDRFDDVIEGKGQGITMLLEGPPGVVSERLRRPLYAMGASELGSEPEKVEDNLHMILEVAAKWDAVLLLDECDVLLAQRSADNLGRNTIVAIFLRLLEYYRGMLFMTTNRVEAIDPAFQSRIHLTIRYPNLDVSARRRIWDQFIQSSHQEWTIPEWYFIELQDLDVNGREIKNIVKTAQLLASHEKVALSVEHMRTALSVTRVELIRRSWAPPVEMLTQ
ncbi:P-loop containing nucleoside triphosphate hydrolase protein [Jackrogersella minutella]|nr:P-loop containing nucleoside triphosphate hydrolase protein [Jackrogersella minutella]